MSSIGYKHTAIDTAPRRHASYEDDVRALEAGVARLDDRGQDGIFLITPSVRMKANKKVTLEDGSEVYRSFTANGPDVDERRIDVRGVPHSSQWYSKWLPKPSTTAIGPAPKRRASGILPGDRNAYAVIETDGVEPYRPKSQ